MNTEMKMEIKMITNEHENECEENLIDYYMENIHHDDLYQIIKEIYSLTEKYLMDDILIISNPLFHKVLVSEISGFFYSSLLELYPEKATDEFLCDELERIVENHILFYLRENKIFLPRSLKEKKEINKTETFHDIKNKINQLFESYQPKQKTKEWYEYRQNILTSSNIDKILGSNARINSLIYEKCKPLSFNEDNENNVNTDSSLHWGNKYEPVSILIYEEMNSTKISSLGCMTHSTIKHLGASPDGINIDETNIIKYGRLIEVKNIVNRDIYGIPSETYWVQMQIQMEVCDINECDFFETRIKEYDNQSDFLSSDSSIKKGIILYFVSKKDMGSKPYYIYMPLDIIVINSEKWIDEKKKEYIDYALYTIIYWYLDEFSCIYVERNKKWFQSLLPKINEIWNIIEYERIHGYLHRMPKQREKKENYSLLIPDSELNL